MKAILLASVLLAPMSAYAWSADPAAPTATATATARGGTATGGAGGAGGAGGSATATQHQHQGQRQSQSVTVNNAAPATSGVDPATAARLAGDPSGGGNGGGHGGRAPDVVLPWNGGGGNDCPVVGFGVGGSGLGGGGGFGPSWISPDCNARKLAELLTTMGYRDAGLAVLKEHFPEVQSAFPAAAPTAQPPPVSKPADWCVDMNTWTQAERRRHPECGT